MAVTIAATQATTRRRRRRIASSSRSGSPPAAAAAAARSGFGGWACDSFAMTVSNELSGRRAAHEAAPSRACCGQR